MKRNRSTAICLCLLLSLGMVTSSCNTSWIQTALADLPTVLQIVTSILTIVGTVQGKGGIDPNLATEVASIGAQAKQDIQSVQNLVQQYQTAAASAKPGIQGQINSGLIAVQNDLSGILAVFHVKDANLQATISASLGIALSTVMAIESLIPAAAPPAPAPAAKAPVKAVKPMNPAQIKAQVNYIFARGGFPEAQIQ